MNDFELEYVDFDNKNASDIFMYGNDYVVFNFNQNTFTNAQTLINDEENETDWNEMEDFGPENEYITTTQDAMDTEIENASTLIHSLTPCVILDMIQGKIKHCNSTNKLRPLKQMIGTWEIDVDAVVDESKLGVCYTHFLFDQNQLHSPNVKQLCSIEKSIIHSHFCIFCNKKKAFLVMEMAAKNTHGPSMNLVSKYLVLVLLNVLHLMRIDCKKDTYRILCSLYLF